jgi:hypothetical protein
LVSKHESEWKDDVAAGREEGGEERREGQDEPF